MFFSNINYVKREINDKFSHYSVYSNFEVWNFNYITNILLYVITNMLRQIPNVYLVSSILLNFTFNIVNVSYALQL